AAEAKQHGKVARCLQEAEGNIRHVHIRLEHGEGSRICAGSRCGGAQGCSGGGSDHQR
ncbi:unnamed protein product, partial [Ectocarpus sp. 8 AP-2014]